MPNPVCISPLKFYDSPAKQNHRKSYAHEHISPLITKAGWVPPFQFIIPNRAYANGLSDTFEELPVVNSFHGYLNNHGTWNTGSDWTTKCYAVSAGDTLKIYHGSTNAYAKYGFFSDLPDISSVPQSYVSNSDMTEMDIITAPGTGYITVSNYSTSAKCEGISIISEFKICCAKTNQVVYSVSSQNSIRAKDNFDIFTVDNYKVLIYKGKRKLNFSTEGLYYIILSSGNGGLWTYYSEVFCFTNITSDCLELEYWNETGNFAIKNGVIAFPADFHFKMLLKTEIGKPEYNFEEESTKRLGYTFVESQVSKKTYKFNVIVPEYICDALRLVRLCDNKIIRCKDDEYEAITFEMEAEWQTQGDLASVTCEFETDNVVANIGGFVSDKLGGDYNNDYNEDFDKE